MPRGRIGQASTSQVSMTDGSGSQFTRPKSARMSVLNRATAESAVGRVKAANHGKSSTALSMGGKFADSRGTAPDGSTTRRGPAARSDAERATDARNFMATTASSNARAQARGKNTKMESDGVLFDKTKRSSMLTESMRHRPDTQALNAASNDAEASRRAQTKRSQASEVFAGPTPSFAQPLRRPTTAAARTQSSIFSNSPVANKARPLRAVNPGPQRPELPACKRTDAERVLDAQRRVISDGAENDRNLARARSQASSVFATDAPAAKVARVSQAPKGSNIFAGGSYADDSKAAALARPRTAAAAPRAFAAGGGSDMSASMRRSAALAGSGSLW